MSRTRRIYHYGKNFHRELEMSDPHPTTKAIEIRCTECGEIVRLRTPTKNREEAWSLCHDLVNGAKSECHQVELIGRLLGYDYSSPQVFDVTDQVFDDIVEIGPREAVTLRDHRTEEWSDDDPTPVEVPRERTNKNVVSRERGKKGQI